MASKREYAYYIKGNKIAIIERGLGSGVCSLSGYSNQTTCEAAGGTWTENAISRDDGEWMSPIATVADGLEIQYTYSPNYLIESTDTSTTTVSGWDQDNDGNFRLRASGSTNWTSSPDLSSVTHIVLRNAGRWNGLHKVSSVTNNRIVTTTKVSASTSETLFEETVTLYYDVTPFTDESFDINLTRYQANAIVYYLKAKMAEDTGNMEQREFFMREFKRQLEKGVSALKRGPYIVQGFKEMR
jgi:hypothetical protein